MTKITGIDIRKELLNAGLRPSDYDEQGIFDYIEQNQNSVPVFVHEIAQLAPRFKKEVNS